MTPQALSLVTLAVADVGRATGFYEALGWRKSSDSRDAISFVSMGGPGTTGTAVGLYGRDALASDTGVPAAATASSAVTLAQNLASAEAVDDRLRAFVDAGGRLVKPAAKADWGGYTGYAADLDGHLWEIAHNPFWPLDEEGRVTLPE